MISVSPFLLILSTNRFIASLSFISLLLLLDDFTFLLDAKIPPNLIMMVEIFLLD